MTRKSVDLQQTPEGKHWAEFGRWIISQRIRQRLPKTDAARAAGMSFSSWTAFEQGGRRLDGTWRLPNPDPESLIGIARSIGVDDREVFRRAGLEPLQHDDHEDGQEDRERIERIVDLANVVVGLVDNNVATLSEMRDKIMEVIQDLNAG